MIRWHSALTAATLGGLLLSSTAGTAHGQTDASSPDADPSATRAVCVERGISDDVHISSTSDNDKDVLSVHGRWEWVGPQPSECYDAGGNKAVVTVYLQSSLNGSSWTTRASGKKTVKPYTGSSNRANARMTCKNSLATKWRALVDVDLVGIADTPEKWPGPQYVVNCGY